MAHHQLQDAGEIANLVIQLEAKWGVLEKNNDASTVLHTLVNAPEFAALQYSLQKYEQYNQTADMLSGALQNIWTNYQKYCPEPDLTINVLCQELPPQNSQNAANQETVHTDDTKPNEDHKKDEPLNEPDKQVDCDICPQQHPATQICLDCAQQFCQQASE